MSVSARFFVHRISKNASGYITVEMSPSTKGDENKSWAHYTPSGKVEMNISPDSGAGAWFEGHLGKDVAISFDEVPEPPASA